MHEMYVIPASNANDYGFQEWCHQYKQCFSWVARSVQYLEHGIKQTGEVQMKTRFRNCVTAVLVASLIAQATPGWAEMIRPVPGQASDRERITAVLARDDVRAELVARGVDPTHAQARVDALSDQEAALLASELDRLPAGAGGSPVEAVGMIIVAVLFVAALVIVVPVVLVIKAVRASASKQAAPAQAQPSSELQPVASE